MSKKYELLESPEWVENFKAYQTLYLERLERLKEAQ